MRFKAVDDGAHHRVLGPRTAYIIGSTNIEGTSHLCAASNVTCVGLRPTVLAVALWPGWRTTENIRREATLTVNLMDTAFLDAVWIVGNKYSRVELPDLAGKFEASGLTPLESAAIGPAGVAEALSILECRMLRVIDDVSDHVIFLVEVVRAICRSEYFDGNFVVDAAKVQPIMQISGSNFAKAVVAPRPDSAWCTYLANRRLAQG